MSSSCPCGSHQDYFACCGKYIEKKELAPTPEALMRSRYTAFALKNTRYIVATMRGKALKKFNKTHTENSVDNRVLHGLTILSTEMKAPRLGYVIFKAHFSIGEHTGNICEKSEFHKIGAQWFYVDGKHKNLNKE